MSSQYRYALRGELSWTRYRLFMRVESDQARQFYLEECLRSASAGSGIKGQRWYEWTAEREAALRGIFSIPCFDFNGKFMVNGAIGVQGFRQAVTEMLV